MGPAVCNTGSNSQRESTSWKRDCPALRPIGRCRIAAGDCEGGFGEGAIVNADKTLRLGMVTSIATLDDTLMRMSNTAPAFHIVRPALPSERVTPSRPPAAGPRLAELQQQQLTRDWSRL
jgi:hypothetical protein